IPAFVSRLARPRSFEKIAQDARIWPLAFLTGRRRRVNDLPQLRLQRAGRRRCVISISDRPQMIDGITVQQQIVSNDPPVAAPPYGLRTHQYQPLAFADFYQFLERRSEGVA